MGSGRDVYCLVLVLVAASLSLPAAFADGCVDPHCLTPDDTTRVRPSQGVGWNLLTGRVVEDPPADVSAEESDAEYIPSDALSGAMVSTIERPGKPAAKKLKIRRYAIDPTVPSNMSLGQADVFSFVLNRLKYQVIVLSFNKDNAQLKFMPAREYSNLSPSMTKSYDVDHDGKTDFSLTMGKVEGGQARFDLKPGGAPPSSTTPAAPSALTTSVRGSQSASIPPSDSVPALDAPPEVDGLPSPSEPIGLPPSPPPPSIDSAPAAPASSAPQSPAVKPMGNLHGAVPSEIPALAPGVPTEGIIAPSRVLASRPDGDRRSVSLPPSSGFGFAGWAMMFAAVGVVAVGAARFVASSREKKNVSTVTDYLLKSLSERVPISQSMDALSKAGWKKDTVDNAMAEIAAKYKADTASRGGDASGLRAQLSMAGMPNEILDRVFKKE